MKKMMSMTILFLVFITLSQSPMILAENLDPGEPGIFVYSDGKFHKMTKLGTTYFGCESYPYFYKFRNGKIKIIVCGGTYIFAERIYSLQMGQYTGGKPNIVFYDNSYWNLGHKYTTCDFRTIKISYDTYAYEPKTLSKGYYFFEICHLLGNIPERCLYFQIE